MARSEWLWPGKLLLSQRRYDEAIKLFQEALARAPEHPSLHWSLGEALCGTRRYTEALPYLQAGLVADDVTRLRALEVQPAQTLVVGDKLENDILPAQRQGFQTWQLTHAFTSALSDAGDWKKLAEWIRVDSP